MSLPFIILPASAQDGNGLREVELSQQDANNLAGGGLVIISTIVEGKEVFINYQLSGAGAQPYSLAGLAAFVAAGNHLITQGLYQLADAWTRDGVTRNATVYVRALGPTLDLFELKGYAVENGVRLAVKDIDVTAGTYTLDADGGAAYMAGDNIDISGNVISVTGLNEKADLIGGVVPANQLPSYVDDVLSFPSISDFPVTGETGKIYLAENTNRQYRWAGSGYAVLSDSGLTTNQRDAITGAPSASRFDPFATTSQVNSKQPRITGSVDMSPNNGKVVLDSSHLNKQVRVFMGSPATLEIPDFTGSPLPASVYVTVVNGSALAPTYDPVLTYQTKNGGPVELHIGGFLELGYSMVGGQVQEGVLALYGGMINPIETYSAPYTSSAVTYNADYGIPFKTQLINADVALGFNGYDAVFSPKLPAGIKGKLLIVNNVTITFSAAAGVTLVLPDTTMIVGKTKSIACRAGEQLTCLKVSETLWVISATQNKDIVMSVNGTLVKPTVVGTTGNYSWNFTELL